MVRRRPTLGTYEIAVATPYRLDLTVTALRRSATNAVDVVTREGAYLRVLGGFRQPIVVRVAQERADSLAVTLGGGDGHPDEHARALSTVRRMLGVDRELAPFNRAAARIPWLRPLAERMRGVKPPRYPTLWEACFNAVVFQQVSLLAASAISRRVVIALSPSLEHDGLAVRAFPGAESFQGASEEVLRAAGLSANKLSTLRRVAGELLSGNLDEAMLDARSSADAAELLCGIKGIGPWTATVILLRGLGRLDVFPMNDTSVAKNIAAVAKAVPVDVQRVLHLLGSQRGMLYYHLLLARLDARGEVGRMSQLVL